jgi:hypothetical protein
MGPSIITIIVSIILGLGVASAAASPCTEEIAQLEQALQQTGNNLAGAPTGQQSVGAQLGYQPTPDSVREAEQASKQGIVAILNRAKAFDAEGKTKECMELVSNAKLRLQ